MGIGAFSSESRTKVETTSTAINTGFSEVAGPATSVNLNFGGRYKVGRGTFAPVVNLTDQGAIAAAKSIADQSLRQVELFGGTVQQAIVGALAAAQSSSSEAIGAVSESQRGEVENVSLSLVKWGALALAVYFAARVFWKGG